MHYYKFNIKDWTRDTAHLSVEEEGVYRRLIDLYYESEQPIPLETQSVIRRLRLGCHEKALGIVLDEFFTIESDGYHHKRCDDELSRYRAKADANRENGKRGGRPKTEENPDGSEKKPKKTLTTNQEPLTTNQEPTHPKSPKGEASEMFEQFWKLYPNKAGKKAAQLRWEKLKVDQTMFGKIMDGLGKQRVSQAWTKDGGQFIPHAATWLNGERWNDEVKPAGNWANGKQSMHSGFDDIDYRQGAGQENDDGSLSF